MAHTNQKEYHGALCCPKCGYDGLKAVNLSMEFHAQQKQSVNGATLPLPPWPVTVTTSRVVPASPKSREKLRAKVEKLRREGKTRAEVMAELDLTHHQADALLYPKKNAAAKNARDKIHQCPKCGKGPFSRQGLGGHLRQVHGIEGTSETAIRAREGAQPSAAS